jgi:IS605 OrfB family transposase
VKVTRIAYSSGLNASKMSELDRQARLLGRVRSLVWDRYGSVNGVPLSYYDIRDRLIGDGTSTTFGVLANAWKETVRDAVDDIKANRAAAKVQARRAVNRRFPDTADNKEERKRLFIALKCDQWTDDQYLRRLMRVYWKRGHNRTHNQIIIRADNVRTFKLTEDGNTWLKIPGTSPRTYAAVPLNTTAVPTGTLRVILRGGKVEVHYAINDQSLKSSHRPCGSRKLGVDKGYTEVLVDSDGRRHGEELGGMITHRSDELKERNARRAKLRSIANQAAQRGDPAKAARIHKNNLGTVKRTRQERAWKTRVRDVTYRAAHAVVDDAAVIVAEDLSRTIRGRTRGKNGNRRLAAWTRGITAQSLKDVSERRGSSLRLVNASYTSQVVPGTSIFGRRTGGRLYCPHEGGVVWDDDHAAAVNILDRDGDPDISLFTPYTEVKRIIQDRCSQRSRLSDQDSSICNCPRVSAYAESESS